MPAPTRPRTLRDLKAGSLIHPIAGQINLTPAIQGIRLAKPSSEKSIRLRRGRASLEYFCTTYLKRHFTAGFSDIHRDLFAVCDMTGPPTGKRVARIAPRKFGKTTIMTLALPLHRLAFELSYFVLLIGESSGMAEGNLSTLTQELESNELLLEDFPHLRPAKDRKGQYTKWTDRQIIVSNHATAMARGMGTRMRGLKFRNKRPDLAILDDPESPETADTFLKRRRHKRWFGGTFMGLGADSWDVFVIGNLPHRDCLIADLAESKEWDGKLWRALNVIRDEERIPIGNTRNDGSALWPESWPIERLERYKREPEVGSLNFAREMMNDPREEEDKAFDLNNFEFFDYTPAMRAHYQVIKIAVDPAGGEKPGEYRKGKRDFCAIVTGGRQRDGTIDVFSVILTKKTPDVQIELLLQEYEKFKPREIGVEENMHKNILAPAMVKAAKEKSLYPTFRTYTNMKNKVARILGIQPLVADPLTRVVRFARHLLDKVPQYFAQFDEFPADFDDGPDATEQLIRLLESARIYGSLGGPSAQSYWTGKK